MLVHCTRHLIVVNQRPFTPCNTHINKTSPTQDELGVRNGR
ncbi:MAG: hypothetical protein R3C62_09650 [Chloroflexota bacterium]